VSAFVDSESLPAKNEHLGHKGHSIDLAVAVESLKNFFFAANLNPVSYAYFRSGGHGFP
jgi:hypothetical protein